MNNAPLSQATGHWANPWGESSQSVGSGIKKTHPGGCFLYPEWLGMRDSNPRMVGPEPTALPLGESPTVLFILDHLFKFVNPHHFCQITNFIV